MSLRLLNRFVEVVMGKFVSIKSKLITNVMVMLSVIFFVVLSVITVLNIVSAQKNLKMSEQTITNAIKAKGMTLATNNSMALRGMASDNAFTQVQDLVRATVTDDADIAYGVYMDNSNMPWANYAKGVPDTGAPPAMLEDSMATWSSKLTGPAFKDLNRGTKSKVIEFAAPVSSNGEVLGFIRYGMSTESMMKSLAEARASNTAALIRTLVILVLLFAFSFFMGYLLLVQLASRITKPIASLVGSAKTIAEGNYNIQVSPESNDEIGNLSSDFESMRLTVKKFTEHLQDLVDEKMQQVNDILNNIDQGLFTINLDGTVNKEYSARANSILKVNDVSNCTITDLFRLDGKQAEAFHSWLGLVSDRHEKQRWNKLVRLAPVLELELNQAEEEARMMEYVSVSYQKVFDKQGNLSKIIGCSLNFQGFRSLLGKVG